MFEDITDVHCLGTLDYVYVCVCVCVCEQFHIISTFHKYLVALAHDTLFV